MKWTVDVDVIRSAGRELYRKEFNSLAFAWLFVCQLALPGDRFVIAKEKA